MIVTCASLELPWRDDMQILWIVLLRNHWCSDTTSVTHRLWFKIRSAISLMEIIVLNTLLDIFMLKIVSSIVTYCIMLIILSIIFACSDIRWSSLVHNQIILCMYMQLTRYVSIFSCSYANILLHAVLTKWVINLIKCSVPQIIIFSV